ncbi:MAG: DUF3047 domain-containing protein [Thermodesulfobacteriota bacterium]|nr:DUF3047 domain-containing protein [Thermodesulfobacteriota bacterium]
MKVSIAILLLAGAGQVIGTKRSSQTIHMISWIVLSMIVVSYSTAVAKEEWVVGRFSAATPGNQPPGDWEPLTFKNIKKYTRYSLGSDSGQTVVKAVCDGSSSGWIRHVRIDPQKYPIIEWRWKITNVFKKGDVAQKAGDDYPARLYITFEFDPKKANLIERAKHKTLKLLLGKTLPAEAINYIWASKAPEGTIVPSPYTKQSMMIVVQRGSADLNQWVTERRDIHADYMAAFGKEPSMIAGIAIMTDGNDTGESAVAYYGDIVMRSKNKKP